LKNFLIIQTAFTGDVILATPLVEKLHQFYPASRIDFLLRKGNEGLLINHPYLNEVLVWDKKNGKIKNLISLLFKIRKNNYYAVINLHRFSSSGFLTVLSGAKFKTGFDKNPLSRFFNKRFQHVIGTGKHEVERNLELIKDLTDSSVIPPRLHPSGSDIEFISNYKTGRYVCIAPASVWYTKQFPKEKWIELIRKLPKDINVYLLGAPSDQVLCEEIKILTGKSNIQNLAGKLNFLQSAALMKDAVMNYVNDSAPLHMASSMNAPVTAVFCSTVPAFGFGPLSDNNNIVETNLHLDCRPCGLHGYKQCPLGHFNCAHSIKIEQFYVPG